MKKYIITLDMDNTLLNDMSNVSDLQLNYLTNLNQMGHIIILATGRDYISARCKVSSLSKDITIISDNGANICSIGNNVYDIIPKIKKEEIINLFTTLNPIIKNGFYKTTDTFYAYNYSEKLSFLYQIESDMKVIDFTINKEISDTTSLTLIIDSNKLRQLEDYLTEFNLKYTLVGRDYKNAICIISKDTISKGHGLKTYVNYMNYNYPIISFGDALNDISMFEVSDVSVAMKNASCEVCDKARYITKYTNNEDGIYHFLNDYLK